MTTIFGILLVVGVLLLRLPVSLFPQEWNQDEAQMLSQGMKLLVDPVPWRSVDRTSSGPVNSFLFTILLGLGFEPGFRMTHFISALLGNLQALVAHLTLLRLSSRVIAVCLALPLVAGFGFADVPDFLHYSSELLPALLLACGFYGLVIWSGRPRKLVLFLSGFSIGTSVWCKLRVLPMVGVLCLAALWIVSQQENLPAIRERLAHAVSFVAGSLLPAGIILGAVFLPEWNGILGTRTSCKS